MNHQKALKKAWLVYQPNQNLKVSLISSVNSHNATTFGILFGMEEKEFVAREGQIDFTNIRWCPVINCVVFFKDRFLVVKRSQGMRLYPGYWTGVSGFIDDDKSLEDKVQEELIEEIGIK